MKQTLAIGLLVLAILLVIAYKKGLIVFHKRDQQPGNTGTAGSNPNLDFSGLKETFENFKNTSPTLYYDAQKGFQAHQPGWQFPMALN